MKEERWFICTAGCESNASPCKLMITDQFTSKPHTCPWDNPECVWAETTDKTIEIFPGTHDALAKLTTIKE